MSKETKYIHPEALKMLNLAYKKANLKPVLVQTMSTGKGVAASKGTHDPAGKYQNVNGIWVPYGVCLDFSVNQLATRLSDKKKVQMNETRIKWFLFNLASCQIPGWYRRESQGFDAHHIHAITAMANMEKLPIVVRQVTDFVDNRNGLKGRALETYWTADEEYDERIADAFAKANPNAAKQLPARFRK